MIIVAEVCFRWRRDGKNRLRHHVQALTVGVKMGPIYTSVELLVNVLFVTQRGS